MTSEEDIIKKRLLIEGDSGNEDRLINKLTKNFVKWTNSLMANSETNGNGHHPSNGNTNGNVQLDEENSEYLFEQMMVSLSNAEFGLLRNHFIYDMNRVEQENYQVLYEKINNEIEKAKRKIIESKLELQEAQKIRKNRQEYDVLSRQIQNYPDRTEMQQTIKSLEEKLEHLKKVDTEYNKKIDLRRKQFSVVLQSLSSLKGLIDTDLKPEDILSSNQLSRTNDDTVAIYSNNNENKIELQSKSKQIDEDMDDDNDATHNSKREKHYSLNEVEMEEIA
jgi:THO complex subunit 7